MITYLAEDTDLPPINQQQTTRWIREVAAQYGKRVGNITYIFCSDDYILRVNNQYLQHNYYTDIITFDYSQGKTISGDLFISLDTVKSNALKFNQQEELELHRVIIHGILHLCGQGDKTEPEQAEMTRKEDEALRVYKVASL